MKLFRRRIGKPFRRAVNKMKKWAFIPLLVAGISLGSCANKKVIPKDLVPDVAVTLEQGKGVRLEIGEMASIWSSKGRRYTFVRVEDIGYLDGDYRFKKKRTSKYDIPVVRLGFFTGSFHNPEPVGVKETWQQDTGRFTKTARYEYLRRDERGFMHLTGAPDSSQIIRYYDDRRSTLSRYPDRGCLGQICISVPILGSKKGWWPTTIVINEKRY